MEEHGKKLSGAFRSLLASLLSHDLSAEHTQVPLPSCRPVMSQIPALWSVKVTW